MISKWKKRYQKWKIWRHYYVSLSKFEQILALFGLGKYASYLDTFKIQEEE